MVLSGISSQMRHNVTSQYLYHICYYYESFKVTGSGQIGSEIFCFCFGSLFPAAALINCTLPAHHQHTYRQTDRNQHHILFK